MWRFFMVKLTVGENYMFSYSFRSQMDVQW